MKFFIPFTINPIQAERVYNRVAKRLTSMGYEIKNERIFKVIFRRGDNFVNETVGTTSDNGEIVVAIFKDRVGFFVCTYSHGVVWGEPTLARYTEVESVVLFDKADSISLGYVAFQTVA